MSKSFELMNRLAPESVRMDLSRPEPRLPPKVPSPRVQRVVGAPDEALASTLWRIIRPHKWITAGFTLAVVAIVTVASLVMKPQYDAVGRMVVVFHRDNDSGVLGFKGVDTSLLEDPEDRAAIDTQISILQTDALALKVIQDLRLDQNPMFIGGAKAVNEDRLVKLFHKSLDISKVKGTRLIQIRFRSPDPQLAADVVNGLAKDYVDHYYQSQFQVSEQISAFLTNQLKELQARVEDSQQKLMEYQKQNGILGLDNQQNIVTTKLADLNKELTASEADRVQKEVSYRLARSGQPELLAKLEPGSLLTTLRAQQDDLERQNAQASVQLGPANPKMAELSSQLSQVRSSIDAEVKRIGDRLTYEYHSAAERERMLRAALEKQKQVADDLDAHAVQSEILKHEFETNRKLYEDLLQKQKELGITASLKSSNIWIVDPARAPKLPSEPNLVRNVALSLAFGLFGGMCLAFGLEKINEKTIRTVEQVQLLSPLPVLGALPLLEANSKNGAPANLPALSIYRNRALVSLLEPMSLAAESYRSVLTSLLLSQPTPPVVIQVTSALAAEGKTTVSANLAILLARLRRRVLLIDADLRRPRIHLAMQLNATAGLGALLKKSVAFEEAVCSFPNLPDLFILPAGPVTQPEDTELLLSTFKELVESWRQRFDHIIIDSPPLLPVADALRLSVVADSVILVIRAGEVGKDTFQRAQDALFKVNAPLTGFVLNGAQLDSADFRYYHSYYSPDQSKRLGNAA